MSLLKVFDYIGEKFYMLAHFVSAAQRSSSQRSAPGATLEQRTIVESGTTTGTGKLVSMPAAAQTAPSRTPAPNRDGSAAQTLLPELLAQRSGQHSAAAADARDELDYDLPRFDRQARAIPDLTPGTAHNARATLNCLAEPVAPPWGRLAGGALRPRAISVADWPGVPQNKSYFDSCPRLHVWAHHQPTPQVRECLVGLWSARAAVPRAPPFVVCRVSDVGADCVWCGLLWRFITVTVTVSMRNRRVAACFIWAKRAVLTVKGVHKPAGVSAITRRMRTESMRAQAPTPTGHAPPPARATVSPLLPSTRQPPAHALPTSRLAMVELQVESMVELPHQLLRRR